MFERFTDRARRVVVLAQEEARLRGHNYIGTEHLLIGILGQPESPATKVLIKLGADLDSARAVAETITDGGTDEASSHIPFTWEGKKVLEHALREALSLGNSYIGIEHLILALVREVSGTAVEILDALNVDLVTLRRELYALGLEAHYGAPTQGGAAVSTRSRAEIERDIDFHFASLEALKKELESIE